MNASMQDLITLIGEQAVEIRLLRAAIDQLAAREEQAVPLEVEPETEDSQDAE